ncbi:tail tubular protein B [Rhizobium phage RHEph15]|uniref:Tail tubular protein B n=1 Tax=Rhizobium phage RHph_TM34 TaxID=2509556 RepID=A0A7S5QVT2_9CAUD|nr:tail tubular protein B [Rhizobium phage RHph_TM34]QXV74298.1 tail tubular protein B [Rhizobium phage RHEph15]QXV74992.1 tail tubular protein B [Rhizobium phage RHEph27]
MAKVDGSVKSLLQGVSQQPPRDRLPGQATLQENMSSDPITGLTRRPATDLVNKLLTSADIRGWHDFDTKDGNKFIAAFYSNTVKVFDLNGTEQTVTVDANAQAYISLAGELRFNTIENDTYVVNRSKTVAMTTLQRSYYNNENRQVFIIQVLGGQYGRVYNVKINGTEYANYQVPNGSVATDVTSTRTKFIATELYNDLVANLTGWSVTLKDDIIVLSIANTNDYTVTVNDDYGNTNIKACGVTVARTEDLPRMAPHNYVVRVAEKTDPETDLWFRFIVEGYENDWTTTNSLSRFGQEGYWQETVAPLTDIELDPATMPHLLSYDATTGTFRFKRNTWANRAVGTTTSNPDPSFVDARITDVATFQGRLVFTSGPNVIMSRTDRDSDFWFGSASEQAESDPIDVRSKVEASTMQAIIQHNRDLVIFSNKGQFIIYGRTKITPANAALVLSSAFEAELRAKPVAAGRNVFFATNFGSYTGIREFYVESGTDINDSRAITQHVKRYIEGKVTKLISSSNYDTLLVQTDADAGVVYWYQYIWNDTEKVQSSWSKLSFSSPVVYMFFDEETVYFVTKDSTDYYLTRMSLDVQPSLDVGYHVHLDNRFDVFEVSTGFVLPYQYLKDTDLIAVQATACPNPGLTVPISSITDVPGTGWVVTLGADMFGGDIVVGSKFASKYIPTMPQVKDQDGVKVGTGNLVISKFKVSLSKTGEIIGQLLSKFGNGPEVRFNGRFVGDINNVVGEQPLSDDTFTLPFGQKADLAEILLSTSSHLPMTLLDIEWEGQYTKRGKRISTNTQSGG